MLLLGALTNTNPVVDGFGVFDLSLTNFITVLANPNVHLALANSLIACGGGTALAVVIGLTFSWIVVRTNTPCKRLIAAASMLPLFVPPLVGGRRLVDPRLAEDRAPQHAAGQRRHRLALQRLFDGRADRRSSASTTRPTSTCSPPRRCATWTRRWRRPRRSPAPARSRTLLTVTFPLIAPAIISGMLLSFIVMLGIYGIPAVLGTPGDIPVLTTYIFKLTDWSPPLYTRPPRSRSS